MANKIYILDANVLIYDPGSLFAFPGARVGIPGTIIEELDQFKREGTDRGRGARVAIRSLDELRSQGSLAQGVKLDNGSIVQVLFPPLNSKQYEVPLNLDNNDNKVLLLAYALQKQGNEVRFITKDLNARVKADALGIIAEDYTRGKVSDQEFYRGWVKVPVPSIQLKKDDPEELHHAIEEYKLDRNQFVILESQHNPHNYRVFRFLGNDRFLAVNEPVFRWPFKARNPQQLMALNVLLDPSIQLVTLFGPAGTGKTFLALLAGLHQVVVEDDFQKLLVARPIVPLGRDIGYLPGSLEEKLHTWMLPVFDNMEFIFHSASMGRHLERVEDESRSSYRGNGNRRDRRGRHNGNGHHHRNGGQQHEGGHQGREHSTGVAALDDLIDRGKISLEAITYMRGRSIPYQYIVIDEVQNLTPHEVKTLVSRVGEGSKIILAGDPYQIDTPYLDFSSNGLVVTSEKFKGQEVFGSVYLERSERSVLSQLASDLL